MSVSPPSSAFHACVAVFVSCAALVRLFSRLPTHVRPYSRSGNDQIPVYIGTLNLVIERNLVAPFEISRTHSDSGGGIRVNSHRRSVSVKTPDQIFGAQIGRKTILSDD